MSTHISFVRRCCLLIAAVLACAGVGLSTSPAFGAAPTLTFSPPSVRSGTTVTLAGGAWDPLDTVTVSVSGPASATLCNVRADSTGAIPAQACTVPTFLPFGSYTVTGSSSGGLTKVAPGKLAVQPAVTVTNPNGSIVFTAAAGSGLGISGTGFAPSSAVTVKVDAGGVATTPATPVTNTNGSVSGIAVTLPAGTTAGDHTVTLRDGQNHTATYTITVYRPTLSLGSGTLVAGQGVAVTGAKWPAGDTLQLFLTKVSPATNAFMCQVRTDGAGTISPGQSCLAPTGIPAGNYSLSGVDVSRYATVVPSGTVALAPSVSLLTPGFSPTVTAAAGAVVQLTGAGFGPAKKVDVTVNGVAAPTTPAVAKTSATGGLSAVTITIPANTPAGARDVVVTDVAGNSATTTVTVYKPTLTVSPTGAAAGTPVVVSGAGWPAGDLVSVQLASGTTAGTICNVPVDSTGALVTPSQQCVAPSLPFGTYTVTGSDFQRYATKTGASFNLSASIALTNTSGTPVASGSAGSTLVVQGAGFAAGSALTVKFNGTNRVTTPSTPTTASNGSFSGVSFTVPSLAPGTYVVTVRDAASHQATASFTIV